MRRGPALGTVVLVVWAGCARPEPTDVEVEVRSVGIDSLSQSPVVVLQDRDHSTALPIWIGAAEAQAIAMEIEGVSPPRPMTHDLMKNLLVQSGVEVRRVVIGDLRDRTYFARIYVHAGGRDVEVDSRPSDAIALAVRLRRPIFVAAGLMKGETAIDIDRAFGSDTLEARGVSVQALSAELAEHFELVSGEGVLVASVADGAGAVRSGDVILAVNGDRVLGLAHFIDKMRSLGAAAVTLDVSRAGERLRITLPAPPA